MHIIYHIISYHLSYTRISYHILEYHIIYYIIPYILLLYIYLTIYVHFIYRCLKDILLDQSALEIFHPRHILDTDRLRTGFRAVYKDPDAFAFDGNIVNSIINICFINYIIISKGNIDTEEDSIVEAYNELNSQDQHQDLRYKGILDLYQAKANSKYNDDDEDDEDDDDDYDEEYVDDEYDYDEEYVDDEYDYYEEEEEEEEEEEKKRKIYKRIVEDSDEDEYC